MILKDIQTEEEMLASAERNLLHMPADVDDLEHINGVPDFWKKAIKNHSTL